MGGNPALDIVVGIASFGDEDAPCAEANRPSVYTRVSKFREWIDERINVSYTSKACAGCVVDSEDTILTHN